ncbi:FtsX-like permease family protein [Puniceicoccales bacterium CK1056]|uniref:FtsX-like permease family protein n=1 Tax=Oceanipulchritudo coccoides TaxID=2706888 RepID=A0A6B2M1V2_9BACT|nr:FtsX-like permease family protein [Oceanipulchritudo coccoides]NDV62703.1 FtsX-like permease family protein [Oceanipulchritudo coccoides]
MSQKIKLSGKARAGWIARMAWRDSRGKRLLLLLFTSSVVFGIGAIVAIHSLRENLKRIVDEQARSLLGSDIVLQTRQMPSSELTRFIASLPGEKVNERRFRSMAFFPTAGESRFVQVRAVDGALPFYGEMETIPEGVQSQRAPKPGHAIIEESLSLQMGLLPGDTVVLGSKEYTIEAALLRMAGESELTGFFAPRIYIPLEGIEETGLIQEGSIVRYRTAIGIDSEELPRLLSRIEAEKNTFFVDESVRVETVEDRRQGIESVLNNLLDFLNLIGFVALLLGGVGIVGAVNVYLQGKRETIAILRCLGSSSKSAFSIYLGQMMTFGLIGASMGTVLGIGAQFIIPSLLQSFLPFPIEMRLSYPAILTGLLFGWLIVFFSALIPLLGIRKISPLSAIRSSVESSGSSFRDPLAWLAAGILLSSLLAFTLQQSRQPITGLYFFGGLLVSLGLLSALAWSLRAALRRLRMASMPYAYRTALGNLYRPNNRTLLMVVTLGMGVLLINTLLLVRDGLLGQVNIESSDDAANVILLDVQSNQRDEVIGLLSDTGLPARDILPVITMRVDRIKGKPMREWKTTPDSPVSDWVYTWEFRNTYRDHVLDNAEVIAGSFVPRYDGGEPYPVSLSENVIEDFGVDIGDQITWNVQGVEVETVVSSIRRVRWQAGRQNFNIVFPLDTIEAAPTVYAISVKSPSRLETANLQQSLTKQFPNVSLIDLSLVFKSLEEILNKATFVIKFMAGFTIATGLLVLAGAVISSRYQRIRESVLFRTLGASTRFIRTVLTLEFLLLGLISGLAGLALSVAASWALLRFVFSIPFSIHPFQTGTVLVAVIFLTWVTGWLTSRGIATQAPLAVLRKE